MATIHKSTLTFLKSLRKNNNRDWFEKHKEGYLEAKTNMEYFIDDVIKNISRFDKRYANMKGKDCMFRIYRDVRFSKDKRPYKVNMGASINKDGRKSDGPGYYLHIEPGESFFAGGIWMPDGDNLKKIRQEIDYNGKILNKILANPAFKKYFGGLANEYKLKTRPKGYSGDHPDIELLKHTSFIAGHSYDERSVLAKNFSVEVAKAASIMLPFLAFLDEALY